MEFVLPAGYKIIPVTPSPVQPIDLAVRSNRDKLEMRYHFIPWSDTSSASQFPNIQSARAALQCASNEEDSYVAVFSLDSAFVRETYQADWGHEFIFRPKQAFSPAKYCKLLALYKHQVGLALLFFLFDDPDNQALEITNFELRMTN